MRIVKVEPRDFYITLDFSLKQVNMILDYLSKCVVEYDGEEDLEMKEADDYMKNQFFKQLDVLSEEIKHGLGSDSPGN